MYETFFSRRAAHVFDSVERFGLPGSFLSVASEIEDL